MPGESLKNSPGVWCQPHEFGPGGDIDKCAVEIEKNHDGTFGPTANLGSQVIPFFQEMRNPAGASGHCASVRSGVSMRMSVRSDNKFAAQR